MFDSFQKWAEHQAIIRAAEPSCVVCCVHLVVTLAIPTGWKPPGVPRQAGAVYWSLWEKSPVPSGWNPPPLDSTSLLVHSLTKLHGLTALLIDENIPTSKAWNSAISPTGGKFSIHWTDQSEACPFTRYFHEEDQLWFTYCQFLLSDWQFLGGSSFLIRSLIHKLHPVEAAMFFSYSVFQEKGSAVR